MTASNSSTRRRRGDVGAQAAHPDLVAAYVMSVNAPAHGAQQPSRGPNRATIEMSSGNDHGVLGTRKRPGRGADRCWSGRHAGTSLRRRREQPGGHPALSGRQGTRRCAWKTVPAGLRAPVLEDEPAAPSTESVLARCSGPAAPGLPTRRWPLASARRRSRHVASARRAHGSPGQRLMSRKARLRSASATTHIGHDSPRATNLPKRQSLISPT